MVLLDFILFYGTIYTNSVNGNSSYLALSTQFGKNVNFRKIKRVPKLLAESLSNSYWIYKDFRLKCSSNFFLRV